MKEEKESLLSESCTCRNSDDFEISRSLTKTRLPSNIATASYILNAILSLVCLALAIDTWAKIPRGQQDAQLQQQNFDIPHLNSPAAGAIQYEWRNVFSNHTPFRGAPGPDFQNIWSDLLTGTLLRVSKDELVRSGEMPSVPFKDGDYGAGLRVAHHLHCLKRIKQFVWWDELDFKFEKGSPEWVEMRDHADHCIDTLRQDAMCHPDISLMHLEYVDHHLFGQTLAVVQRSAQMCARWDVLKGWMGSRSGKNDMLVPPPTVQK